MKAIVCHKYGPPDLLQVEDVERPSPGDHEVLVKIRAVSVNPLDWRLLRADPFFLRLMGFGLLAPKHKILGADVAGRVEAVGARVTRFRPGDEVFGEISDSGLGGFAEYVCAREDLLVAKPASMSFEEAAALPVAALTALQGLRDEGRVEAGQRVLINGAGGGVGTFAVQIAKSLGAEVTGVCSTGKLELVRSLGADHVIDYTGEDFTRSGRSYDVILDNAAYRPLRDYQRVLDAKGVYVLVGGPASMFLRAVFFKLWASLFGGMDVRIFTAKSNEDDLMALARMFEAGTLKPVIGRRHTLEELPAALRYLEAGHTQGKVVVTV